MNDLFSRALQLASLMLPAYVANMMPVLARYWRVWNAPISKKLLGSHKTIVGFFLGVVGAVLAAFVLSRIAWEGGIVDFDDWLLLGFLMGFGAMLGDSVKSFFKRRKGIAPGKRWMPFDQLDFVAGALVLVWPLVSLSLLDVAIILAITFVGHIFINHLGYWLGMRETPW